MSLSFLISESISPTLLDMIEQSENLPMESISQLLINSVHENFLEQGRPDPWLPRVENPYDDGHPLLMDTGNLYDSIYASTITNEEIVVESSTEYGDFLNSGTTRMAARPFLIMQDTDADEIENLLAQHFNMTD